MHKDIRRIADALVSCYGTHDPFRLASYEGIHVLRPPLPPGVRGFYQAFEGVRIIHVNGALVLPLADAVCAHELGHALLHPARNSPLLSENPLCLAGRPERDAELFAFYLLEGEDAIRYYGTLECASAVTGLSERALQLGLEDLAHPAYHERPSYDI